MNEYIVKVKKGYVYKSSLGKLVGDNVQEIPKDALAFITQKGVWSGFIYDMNHVGVGEIIWKRQPESQNPLDDVKWFEGDLKVSNGYTIGEDCDSDKKYNHYFKNVKHLDYVDVYRVLDLFEVVDPCIQHAIKKLLCAGMRGAKNQPQDVQEAIDSLIRYQEMRKEDRK